VRTSVIRNSQVGTCRRFAPLFLIWPFEAQGMPVAFGRASSRLHNCDAGRERRPGVHPFPTLRPEGPEVRRPGRKAGKFAWLEKRALKARHMNNSDRLQYRDFPALLVTGRDG
jgi:hypothetical protein